MCRAAVCRAIRHGRNCMARNQSSFNRRHFLLTSGAVVAGTGAAWSLLSEGGRSSAAPAVGGQGPMGPGPVRRPPAVRPVVHRAAPYGLTTLDSAARLSGPVGGYRRIVQGSGWPVVVRSELAAANAGRA